MSAEESRRRCPQCGAPAVPAHRPFCSKRCRQVDLNRWLVGAYRIETDEAPEVVTADPAGEEPEPF